MNGDTPYEFRTTVGKDLHTACEMRGIGEWLRGAKRYFLQPFENCLLSDFCAAQKSIMNPHFI